jgi:uncharacterized protein
LQNRYLLQLIKDDAFAAKKMAFISGPRQVGKTTLAKNLLKTSENYFSWDQTRFRKLWSSDPEKLLSLIGKGPLVLDEIHKDRRWKQRIKGLYDVAGQEIPIIVTGSARLNIFRKGGDSLLGRYLPYRLYPFTVGERISPPKPLETFLPQRPRFPLADLLNYGVFPEPLLQTNKGKSERWSRLRQKRLIQEDVRDLRNISDLAALTVLCDFLPERVGSLLSVNNLREDVGVAYATVRDWITVLEALYFCFILKPYSRKLNRMVRAESKLYLFDIISIKDPAVRLENLTALHLQKSCDFWTDSAQGNFELYFLRTKDKKEIDFFVTRDKKPWMLVECKSNQKTINPTLKRFKDELKTPLNIQLVNQTDFHKYNAAENIHVCDYEAFLSQLI